MGHVTYVHIERAVLVVKNRKIFHMGLTRRLGFVLLLSQADRIVFKDSVEHCTCLHPLFWALPLNISPAHGIVYELLYMWTCLEFILSLPLPQMIASALLSMTAGGLGPLCVRSPTNPSIPTVTSSASKSSKPEKAIEHLCLLYACLVCNLLT